ncbi:MAG: hypothetical protein RL085_1028, partial [Actinomycetota bacterium]
MDKKATAELLHKDKVQEADGQLALTLVQNTVALP